MSADVVEMIRDEHGPVVYVYHPMEIVQNKESGKPETIAPERIRNPGVQVIVIGRWSVVGHHRRPFFVVIIIYHLRIGVILCTGGFSWVGFIARKGSDSDAELGGNIIQSFQRLLPAY